MSRESAMSMLNGASSGVVTPPLVPQVSPMPEPKTEAATEVPKTEAVTTAIDSDRFAMLAKKEAKVQKEREEWKAQVAKERAEIEELKTKLKTPYEKIQAFEALKAKDPIAALKEIGFTETDIFNFMAGQEKKEPTTEELARAAAAEEVNKFKQEQAKVAAELQKSRETALLSSYTDNISNAIKKNPDKYEYANYFGEEAKELGLEFARECVKANQEPPTPEEVAEAVEEYYEEQDKAMSALKKRQPKVEVKAPSESDRMFKKEPERTRTLTDTTGKPLKTLTNKATATVASTVTRKETHEQKKERLIAALKAGTYKPPV